MSSLYLQVITPRFTGVGQGAQLLRGQRLHNSTSWGGVSVAWPGVYTSYASALIRQQRSTIAQVSVNNPHLTRVTFTGGVGGVKSAVVAIQVRYSLEINWCFPCQVYHFGFSSALWHHKISPVFSAPVYFKPDLIVDC